MRFEDVSDPRENRDFFDICKGLKMAALSISERSGPIETTYLRDFRARHSHYPFLKRSGPIETSLAD